MQHCCLPAHSVLFAATPPRRSRERRQQQEALDRQKKLGEAGEDVDDVMAWVKRSRAAEERKRADAAAERRRRAEELRRQAEAEDEEDEEDEEGMPSAAELAGAKVKHTADELDEGETMILTLGERRSNTLRLPLHCALICCPRCGCWGRGLGLEKPRRDVCASR